MAVITRYIVVRDGVELDLVFTDKREAVAYDKMLDAAQDLATFIKEQGPSMSVDSSVIDALSVFLAKNGPDVVKILKSVKPAVLPSAPPAPKETAPVAKAGTARKKPAASSRGRKKK